jgi:hypothetical protein
MLNSEWIDLASVRVDLSVSSTLASGSMDLVSCAVKKKKKTTRKKR